jgi:hypothetical protein
VTVSAGGVDVTLGIDPEIGQIDSGWLETNAAKQPGAMLAWDVNVMEMAPAMTGWALREDYGKADCTFVP